MCRKTNESLAVKQEKTTFANACQYVKRALKYIMLVGDYCITKDINEFHASQR